MTVNTTYIDPSEGGALDIDSGGVLTETKYDGILSDVLVLGGTTGRDPFGRRDWNKGGDIASATATAIDTDGNFFDITGTTTITSFSGMTAGLIFALQFDGALVLTHHSTNIKLPGGANITTAAGDIAMFHAEGATTSRCIAYTKASGAAVVGGGGKVQQHSFVAGSSGGISTTSNSYVDITDMKRTLTTTGGDLVARMTMNIDCDNSGTYFYAAFQLDSATEVGAISLQAGSNGETHCLTAIYKWTSVSEASHTVDGRWKTTSSNSLDCDNNERYMELMEVD